MELSALYRDAVITYGEGKVLGILATKTSDHEIRKRAVADETTQESQTTATTSANANANANADADQTNQTDFIYYPGDQSAYKILMYTDIAPRLFDGANVTVLNNIVPTTITTDRRNQNDFSEQRTLKVRYNYKDKVSVLFCCCTLTYLTQNCVMMSL